MLELVFVSILSPEFTDLKQTHVDTVQNLEVNDDCCVQ